MPARASVLNEFHMAIPSLRSRQHSYRNETAAGARALPEDGVNVPGLSVTRDVA